MSELRALPQVYKKKTATYTRLISNVANLLDRHPLASLDIQHFSPAQIPSEKHHLTSWLQTSRCIIIEWDDDILQVVCELKKPAHDHLVPLIALTPNRQAIDIALLIAGADAAIDYTATPALLDAIIEAYKRKPQNRNTLKPERKAESLPISELTLRVGPISVDTKTLQCWVGDEEIDLKGRAFDLLVYLMEHPGKVISRDELLNSVWGIDFDPETNVLDVQLCILRRALKSFNLDNMVTTVRGKGLQLLLSSS